MPRRSKISLLPAEVRDALNARLREANYGDILGASQWLFEQGFPIGKTAVCEYAMKYRKLRRGRPDEHDAGLTELRLECLRVAAQAGPARNLLARASRYLEWVTNPTA